MNTSSDTIRPKAIFMISWPCNFFLGGGETPVNMCHCMDMRRHLNVGPTIIRSTTETSLFTAL